MPRLKPRSKHQPAHPALDNDIPAVGEARTFSAEVWQGVRPYAVCFTKDFLIAALLYLLHLLFEWLMHFAPVPGWPGVFIANLHATGTVLAFALFIGLLLHDVMRIHRRH